MNAQKVLTAFKLLRQPRKLAFVVLEKLSINLPRFSDPAENEYFYRSIEKRIQCRSRKFLAYELNLNSPSLLTEKINWRKKYAPDLKRMALLADKIQSARYAESIIGSDHILPLLWHGSDFNADTLREIAAHEGVVFKTSHQSGQVIIIEPGDCINWNKLADALKDNLKWSYSMVGQEAWYGHIKPEVLAQRLLKSHRGAAYLDDAKFHIFQQPDGSQEVIGQIVNSKERWRVMLDEDGKLLPFDLDKANYPCPEILPELPLFWLDMLEDAKRLASGIDYVRVDFMFTGDNYYFTEFTFAPNGGYLQVSPSEWNKKLGDCWHLDTGTALSRFIWLAKAWLPQWRTERPMRNIRRLYRYHSEWAYMNKVNYLK